MTEHQRLNTAQAKQPCPQTDSNFTCGELDQQVMVGQKRQTEEPKDAGIHVESWSEDTASTASKESFEEECPSENGMEIAVPDQSLGNFGNVVVKNSTDVQFGNNTYYQGPVVIKQFMYNGTDDPKLSIEDGTNNLAYSDDNNIKINDSECVKTDQIYTKKIPNSVNEITTTNQDTHWLNYTFKKRRIYTICLTSLLFAAIILGIILLMKKSPSNSRSNILFPEDSNEQEKDTPVDTPLDPNNVTLSGKLKIIPRVEWLAQPPSESPTPLPHPVPYVIILHTATENCSDQATCVYHIRTIQTFHMESKHWWDIGYNFLVGGDGFAYDGRGWFGEGAHTYGYNSRSIGIGFIGTFNNLLPPERQIRAAKQLIELGVNKGYIAKNYKLLAHRQVSSTQSPGEVFYENIQTWPHWSAKP